MNGLALAEGDAPPRDSSSLERMLSLLDLFEEDARLWTFEEMHTRLGYTRSTLYRYLKILTDAGILTSLPGLGYALGPRIAELDYGMRARDPLIVASRPVMTELVAHIPGIALLCRVYRDKVLCVHQEQSDVAFHSTYERGRALPLLRGAASRIILANLPAAKWLRLYAERPDEFAEAGLGESSDQVRTTLKRIRADGFDLTTEQVTAGVTGIAAPLFDSQRNVLGSLSLTVPQKSLSEGDVQALTNRIVFAGHIVTKTIASRSEI